MADREENRMMLAAFALSGLMANPSIDVDSAGFANYAVIFADALLAELERTRPAPSPAESQTEEVSDG